MLPIAIQTLFAPSLTCQPTKIAKDSDSAHARVRGLLVSPEFRDGREVMAERTCAACDCKLDTDVIQVKIGGKTVEVCCEDCAQKLREADASTTAKRG